jgi:hypothetical protein
MLITAEQLQEIRQIIADHHEALIVDVLGPEAVTPEQLKRLVDGGLVGPQGAVQVDNAMDAYVFGQLLALAEQKKSAHWTLQQLHAHLRKEPVPLTQGELHALTLARERAGQYIRGLGNTVSTDTGVLLIEADAQLRNRMRAEVRSQVEQNVARRETARQLRSNLGWATQDWTRDWDRIARTEQQAALREGQADAYRKKYGSDVLVARTPQPDACQHCKRLHLGPDGQPRIFPLSVLTQHGTNVGRKAADWQAVVGPIHSNCACTTVRVPAGWGFDEFGDLVPGGELGERYGSEEELEDSLRLEGDLLKSRKTEGPMTYQGIKLFIESPVGSTRRWEDGQGGMGETKMQHAYGFAEKTAGADGEAVDVFVGPDPKAPMAYVIEQQDPTGRWDEHKVMLGFSNQVQAEDAYRAHYDRPDAWMLYVTAMPLDHLQRWLAAPEVAVQAKLEPRLVVPLTKASVEVYAHTRAHMRSPSPGTSANYQEGQLPPRPRSPEAAAYSPTARELISDSPVEEPIRGDLEDLFPPTVYQERPVYSAAGMGAMEAGLLAVDEDRRREEIKARRKYLAERQAMLARRPTPYAHPEDEEGTP